MGVRAAEADSGRERTRCGQNETETARKINKNLMFCTLNHCCGVSHALSLSISVSLRLSQSHGFHATPPSMPRGSLGNFTVQLACDVLNDDRQSDNARSRVAVAVAVARCLQGSR